MHIDPLQPKEQHLFRRRVLVIGVVFIFIFSLLGFRLWMLQIVEGPHYSDVAKGNRIRLIHKPALRGMIYDRNGEILAENRPAYQLRLIRSDTTNLEQTLTRLETTLEVPENTYKKIVKAHRKRAKFKSIILDKDLSESKAILVETYQEDFPGVSIVVQARRFYPHGNLASHVIGYVGATSNANSSFPASQRLSSKIVGRVGAESIWNVSMVGEDGGRQVEVDHRGRELRVLGKPVPPVPGSNIQLTLNLQLQNVVQNAMEGKSGAVVVMNPKNGDILAMGSFPDFDPNVFVGGITQKQWKKLIQNPAHPLENKNLQGLYPPGSIFKIVTAYAGLDLGIIDNETTFLCNGYYYIKGGKAPFKCWKRGGHGVVNLKNAIKGSCNVFFYNVGMEVGVDRLHDYAQKLGLGKITGIDLKPERKGLIPNHKWKRRIFGERWYPGETPSVSIGQGYLSVTPLQLINLVNLVANQGVLSTPHLLLNKENAPQKTDLKSDYLAMIRDGMFAVVNEKGGTARKVRIPGFNIAGKTATSQIISSKTRDSLGASGKTIERAFLHHGLFGAFAPAEDPEISVVVLVEHGGSGSRSAAPVAKKIFDYYYKNIYNSQKVQTTSSGNIFRPSSGFTERLNAAFP